MTLLPEQAEEVKGGHPGTTHEPSVRREGPTASRPEKWSEEQLAKMRRFAKGRVTAERFGDPFNVMSEVWAPKVAGMYVRVAGQHYGWAMRSLALEAGRRYRKACRDKLASLGDGATSRPPQTEDDRSRDDQ